MPGMPNLVQAHREIEMTVRSAQKWCDYMEETIDELVTEKIILEKFRNILMNYFKYTAYNLVAAQEAQCLMVKMGCRDELKEELEYDNEVLLWRSCVMCFGSLLCIRSVFTCILKYCLWIHRE